MVKVDWAELPILKVVGEVVFCGIAVAEQLRGAVANQHECFPPICAAWTALMATWRAVWMTKVCSFLLSLAAGMRPGWSQECCLHCQVMARWHFWTCS